jgi:ABC-type nitrate/sulfonate/bicarbonate transport system permease component
MRSTKGGRDARSRDSTSVAGVLALQERPGRAFVPRRVVGRAIFPGRIGFGFAGAIRLTAKRRFVALRSFIIFFAVWYLAALWNGNALQLPSPVLVAAALFDLAIHGELFADAFISIVRLFVSLVLAVLLAVPLGFLMGLNRSVNALLDPVIELLRPISGIAWIPLGLFIFGVGATLPIFIMVYVAFFPLLLNTIAGVRNVDHRLVAAARTMGVDRFAMLRHILAPSALPMITVGLRLAFAGGWSAIIAAELIGSTSGLGYAVEWYHELLMTPKVFAFIATIGGVGYLWDLALRALQRRLTPWAEGLGTATTGGSVSTRRAFHWHTILRASALPVLLVIVWQLWAMTLPANTRAPSPAGVITTFIDLVANGGLIPAIALSLMRVIFGFCIALVLGGGLGILMGANRRIGESLDPIIESLRPIAPIALLPIAILWFGTGTPAAVFIVAYAAFFPALVNAAHGVSQINRRLVQAAETMGVRRLRILASVVLPAALPTVLLGARISMGMAWTAIVAAELAVGAKSGGGGSGGIGQMMFNFYAYSINLNAIVVCMIVVGTVALLLDRLFRLAERELMPWRL